MAIKTSRAKTRIRWLGQTGDQREKKNQFDVIIRMLFRRIFMTV